MAFDPEKITKEHVLNAVQEIQDKGIELIQSTGYDVIIEGENYPPKEIMRYAHEKMNGEHIWEKSGGEPTNRYLQQLGFEINTKEMTPEYYALGAVWNGRDDQSERFIEDGIWENGYDNKFLNVVQSVNIGDRVAIKSSFAKKNKKSYLRIKALGTVTENPGDGRTLHIQWDPPFEAFDLEGYGSYRNTIQKVPKGHVDIIFYHSNTKATMKTNNIMRSKNIILYGPPGTGKTYNSIDKAVEIAVGKSLGSHAANKAEFDRLRNEGQIEFVTFHQNYTYEDFMLGLRPDTDDKSQLRFKRVEGVFLRICNKARLNFEGTITFDEIFSEVFGPLETGQITELSFPYNTQQGDFLVRWNTDNQELDILPKSTGKPITNRIDKEIIEEIYIDEAEYGFDNKPSWHKTYFKPIADYLRDKTHNTSGIKKYVLVIDEINRANISKVFGELITLLEDDKRLGEENELKITLPNGEKDFGVPPNLYIIGTMNTADKSIALIDIALRRRFEFIGYYPTEEVLNRLVSEELVSSEKAELLKQLNKEIFRKRNSADYLIGHAYFMNDIPIEVILRNKVIPLLMEYFSGKTKQVSEVFDTSSWKVDYQEGNYRWDITPK